MARLPLSVDPEQEVALLVGVQFKSRRGWDVHDSLDELALLADTAGAKVFDRIICHLVAVHSATFIGKGKAAQIAEQAREAHATMVIFDEELSPVQNRNLEDALGVKVIDRTQLILDIFAQHARTKEGGLQIELAQLQYLLPRIRQLWAVPPCSPPPLKRARLPVSTQSRRSPDASHQAPPPDWPLIQSVPTPRVKPLVRVKPSSTALEPT